MNKTTIYLPADLRAALKRLASKRGVSEAEIIRDSLRNAVEQDRPAPRGALFAGGESIADRVDELLDGYGER
ncbi:MAG: CopG family transcriptional regulator [Actinomycetes bacterium]